MIVEGRLIEYDNTFNSAMGPSAVTVQVDELELLTQKKMIKRERATFMIVSNAEDDDHAKPLASTWHII